MLRKFVFILLFVFSVNLVFGETYTMKSGDTLSSVAKKYGVTVNDILKVNNIKNPNNVYKGTKITIPEKNKVSSAPAQKVTYETYTVKKGDSLSLIADKTRCPLKDVMSANNITNVNKIYVGQKLRIPRVTTASVPTSASKTAEKITYETYTVKKGDNLSLIADKNKCTLQDVMSANNITNVNKIYVGQKLRIPRVTTASAPTSASKTGTASDKSAGGAGTTSVAVNTKNNPYFWPVEGTQRPLDGKLKGTLISSSKGSVVHSVSTGKVIYEGRYRGMGRVLMIESATGYVYVYGGNENTLVKVGDKVTPGTELGVPVVNVETGKSDVYFSVYKDGIAVDERKAPRV
ncbi:MAG: LysM peptidoglycan-binding domain-containing protein [Spirochaetia bacterium]|nr:LysM peptidoglycan-binding domain-containing protein [Spirochaetia bacterium]